MKIRRIVTGHDEQGNSVFVSDDYAPRAQSFASIPGHGMAQLWTTPANPPLLEKEPDPTLDYASLIPPQGGTSIAMYDFPPDTVMQNPVDGVRVYEELGVALPGLFESFEADNPGMHTTPTIDYGVILEGEMWLELDNGESRLVKAGEIVIQNGTRHAWRNKSDRIARALFVMIGTAPPEKT
ncbi:cupin domain-containing protein [Pseudomonas sp. GM102]|uniref:cupin domain-containing protein n=1 Tax=Pseudomonas sp. GM102 TaxID=1144321 RepID=UPI00026F7893|nr:cupin domain-containing protein [Pseudomonas sp. GM102]